MTNLHAVYPDFVIKICGVRSLDDARLCVEAGADAIGLNFWAQSKRHVDVAAAHEIVDTFGGQVSFVGVFVNERVEVIEALRDKLALDWIQLHGDEDASTLELLGSRAFKALRYGAPLQWPGRYLLVDAPDDAAHGYGGAGVAWRWQQLRDEWSGLTQKKILAGGLSPQNVAEAIAAVAPDAVDVASGVERSPGIKDAEKARAFVSAAKAAFAAQASS